MAIADAVVPAQRSAGTLLTVQAGRRSGERWVRRYVSGLLVTDAAVGLVVALAATQLRFTAAGLSDPRYALLLVLLPAAWVAVLALHRGYDARFLFAGNEEYQRVLRAGVTLAAGVVIGSYTLQADIARGYLLLAMPAVVVLGLTSRFLRRRLLSRAWAAGRCLRRVLVVGHERSVGAMARQLRHERYHGMDVVAACLPARPDDAALPTRVAGTAIPVYGAFDQVAIAARYVGADGVVVLACPELDGPELRRLAWQLEQDDVDLIVASALLDVGGERTTLRPVDGLPMLHVEHPRLTGGRRVVKELVDRVGAALALVALAPLLAGIAISIKLDRDGRGPVLFRQTRVGRDGAEFPIWKFRTMHPDAETRRSELQAPGSGNGVLFKLRDDPRVTRSGRWLRRFSLDELPQLVNVVRGEMSLVGPRPPLPDEVARYPSDMRRRLRVKPGMTGLWQVSGRADLSWEDSVRLDLQYVENWSLTSDLVIMLRTGTAVLRRSGAY